MNDNLPPLSGASRATRSDKGTPRKSSMDAFADTFRRMSPGEQQTALEVLRQLQRVRVPVEKEEPKDAE